MTDEEPELTQRIWPNCLWLIGGSLFFVAVVPTNLLAASAVMGLALLMTAWDVYSRPRISVTDGVVRVRQRRRDERFTRVDEVTYFPGRGFPRLSIRIRQDPDALTVLPRGWIGFGSFYRWGPKRWNRLLDIVGSLIDDETRTDRGTRSLLRLDR